MTCGSAAESRRITYLVGAFDSHSSGPVGGLPFFWDWLKETDDASVQDRVKLPMLRSWYDPLPTKCGCALEHSSN
jgi:hypothetical protein